MLKSGSRLLVTLVLALAATAIFSTLCPARGVPSLDGSGAAVSTSSVKPKPVAYSGEPDTPQAPPPPAQVTGGGIMSPSTLEGSPAGVTEFVWWISWIWATWYRGTAP